MAKKLTRIKAIRQKCLKCVGFEQGRVKSCTCDDCQLYLFRMGKRQKKGTSIPKAIYSYCLWCSGNNRGNLKECPSEDCVLWTWRMPKVTKEHHGRKLTQEKIQELRDRMSKAL